MGYTRIADERRDGELLLTARRLRDARVTARQRGQYAHYACVRTHRKPTELPRDDRSCSPQHTARVHIKFYEALPPSSQGALRGRGFGDFARTHSTQIHTFRRSHPLTYATLCIAATIVAY